MEGVCDRVENGLSVFEGGGDVSQCELAEFYGVSRVSVSNGGRRVTGFFLDGGVVSPRDLGVTARSFGYTGGEDFEGFCRFLAGRVEQGCVKGSSGVLAAGILYVGSKVI